MKIFHSFHWASILSIRIMNGNDVVLKSMLSASTRTVNSDYYDIHVVASFHVSWAKKSSEWDVVSALVGETSSHIITILSLHNDEIEFWYIGEFFNLLLRNFSLYSRRGEWGALITSKEYSMRIKAVHFRVAMMGKNEKREEGKSRILTERGLAGVMELRRTASNSSSSSTSTMMMHRVRWISLWNIPISMRHWKNISTGSDGWTDMTSSFALSCASSIMEITFCGLLNRLTTKSGSFYNLYCDQSKQKKCPKLNIFQCRRQRARKLLTTTKNFPCESNLFLFESETFADLNVIFADLCEFGC